MSEKIKRFTGIMLLLASVLASMIPMLSEKGSDAARFRSRTKPEWAVSGIDTERNGPIAVNEATEEELRLLPGIGETLSSLMVMEREEHGPYYYAEDLESIKGIGPGTLERFRDMIDLAKEESGE